MHLNKVTLYPEKYPTKDHYPFNLEFIQTTQSLNFIAPVTFFVGENGSGKSTLLDAITRKCGVFIWQGIAKNNFIVDRMNVEQVTLAVDPDNPDNGRGLGLDKETWHFGTVKNRDHHFNVTFTGYF